MLLVGKKPDYNYCSDQAGGNQDEKQSMPLIINELPRFAADLNDADETEIRNAQNGLTQAHKIS